jgi:hypothetical protein
VSKRKRALILNESTLFLVVEAMGVEQQKMIEWRQKHICNAPKHLLKM